LGFGSHSAVILQQITLVDRPEIGYSLALTAMEKVSLDGQNSPTETGWTS
jgi:hypothetical protein